MSLRFEPLDIPDVILIEPTAFHDHRGFFLERYKASAFAEHGLDKAFVQENFSRSAVGVLRGLHYQNPPNAIGKLVSVLSGEIYDVAADIRTGSPTYGHWVGVNLSDDNHQMLWVPEGFAHGFLALRPSDVLYKQTGEYAPDSERGIAWNDPDLAIEWPDRNPILSEKDARLPHLRDADNGFVFH